jgi:hypothetical protein
MCAVSVCSMSGLASASGVASTPILESPALTGHSQQNRTGHAEVLAKGKKFPPRVGERAACAVPRAWEEDVQVTL